MVENRVLFTFLTVCITCSFAFGANTPLTMKTYIVHIDKTSMPQSFSSYLQWYSLKLQSVVSKPKNRIIYSYSTAFHGMAVQLSQEEAKKLEEDEAITAIYPDAKYQLHTTRSPQFLGLVGPQVIIDHNAFSPKHRDHSNVVVGVLDTGIWPESQSFNDTGMTPVPLNWKGACETGRAFSVHHCNRKIIGARVFYKGYEASAGKINEQSEFKSPRDQDGHGTHTAATVAGSPVRGANLLGYANGIARGMAPSARIAAYKVCWAGGCFSSDILSAVDTAVADGVNIMSISLGGGVSSYYHDSLSIATFGAMEKGVFVSCSAGNGGPDPVSLTNVSPWITTVGASTMDRDFPSQIKLGTGRTITGSSLYKGRKNLLLNKQYPLIYMGGNSSSPDASSLCLEGTLDPHKVGEKIVICDRGVSPRVQKGQVVKDAGGIGMILANTAANGQELVSDCHLLPAVAVGQIQGKEIKHYVLTNPNPTATLAFLGTRLGIKPSPVVAAFSSRGPNFLSLEILKPDLVAPGVDILAAWAGDLGPSSLPTDHRRVKFNILSGTSMSCPHVSGIAALIKTKHPQWSPAAIKSALMTTAYVHDNTKGPLTDASAASPSTPFDHGAGHINPVKALDPGLIYDIGAQDYYEFLCTQRLTPMQLQVFSKYSNRSCKHSLASPGDLNYPGISVVLPDKSSTLTIHRTVTNVGPPISIYHVAVTPFKGVTIKVEPQTLNFSSRDQKLSYTVTFVTKISQMLPEFGGLVWKNGIHKVRSPIIITWLIPI